MEISSRMVVLSVFCLLKFLVTPLGARLDLLFATKESFYLEKLDIPIKGSTRINICSFLSSDDYPAARVIAHLHKNFENKSFEVYSDIIVFSELTIVIADGSKPIQLILWKAVRISSKVLVIAPFFPTPLINVFFESGIFDVLILVRDTLWTLNYFNKSIYEVETFDDKLKDLHGYNLILTTSNYLPLTWFDEITLEVFGPAVTLAQTFAEQRNSSCSVKKQPQHYFVSEFENGDINNYFEMIAPPDLMTSFVWLQGQSGGCVILKKNDPKTFIEIILSPFSPMIFYVFAAVVLVHVCLIGFLSHQWNSRILFHFFRAVLGQSEGVGPRLPKRYEALTFLSFEIFAFILSTAYISIVISQLTSPGFGPSIKTFEELNRSTTVVTTYPNIYNIINKFYDPHFASHFEVKDDFFDRDEVPTTIPCSVLKTFIPGLTKTLHLLPNQLYALKEKLFVTALSIHVTPKKPFHDLYQLHIHRFYETGLWAHWTETSERTFNHRFFGSVWALKNLHDDDLVLNFADFKHIFLLFFAGLGVSCVFFGLEVALGLFKTNQLRRNLRLRRQF